MKNQNKNQDKSQDMTGGVNRDFSKQNSKDLRDRMKGEHSLQVDHAGDTFRQSEQGNAGEYQEQWFQQHRQFESHHQGSSHPTGGRNQPGS